MAGRAASCAVKRTTVVQHQAATTRPATCTRPCRAYPRTGRRCTLPAPAPVLVSVRALAQQGRGGRTGLAVVRPGMARGRTCHRIQCSRKRTPHGTLQWTSTWWHPNRQRAHRRVPVQGLADRGTATIELRRWGRCRDQRPRVTHRGRLAGCTRAWLTLTQRRRGPQGCCRRIGVDPATPSCGRC